MREIKLHIGGKERTFHFGLGFHEEALVGEGVSNIMEISSTRLMYYSMVYALKREGKDVDFTLYDVFDWMDDAEDFTEITTRFQIGFMKSMASKLETKEKAVIDKVVSELEKKLKPQKKAAKTSK